MARVSPIGDQILELFEAEAGKPKKRFTLKQLQDILDHLDPMAVKHALDRLRGQDGAEKRLRAVGYVTQVGHGGKAMPILELGGEADVPRTEEYVEDGAAEIARKASRLRALQEDRRLQKELAAIDNYE
jgi:hypothetical protein